MRRCLVVVEFSGQLLLNVRALQGSYLMPAASINASNSFGLQDCGKDQCLSWPVSHLKYFISNGEEHTPQLPQTTWHAPLRDHESHLLS